MGIIKGLLIVIEVISSVLLICIILLQKAKDEGLGLAFGAGVGETLFGSRAGNVLTKITIGLAIVFLVNTMLIGLMISGGGGTTARSVTDSLPSTPAAPVQPATPGALPLTATEGTAPAAPVEPSAGSAPVSVPVPAPVPVSVPAPAATPAPAPAAP